MMPLLSERARTRSLSISMLTGVDTGSTTRDCSASSARMSCEMLFQLSMTESRFYETHGIKLDPIYTGKMMQGIYQLIQQGQIADSRVLAIHTGGLQGIAGVELKTGKKLFDS